MAQPDDLNTPMIAIVGFLGAIATFAIIVVLQVLYYQLEAVEQYKKEVSQAPAELSNVLADQEAKLAGYRWVDQQKRLVAVPIDRAMRLVVDDLAAGRDPVRYAPRTTAAGSAQDDDSTTPSNQSTEEADPPEASADSAPTAQGSEDSAEKLESAGEPAAEAPGPVP